MATTVARTKDEVNKMNKPERLWDSLSYAYGRKGDLINNEYNKAYSQADRQMLSRGMQRSSYGAQVLDNINKNRTDALNDNQSALIADYENRLGEIEQQEAEADRWEREFAANREDAAWQKENADRTFNYQKERDAVGDNQWNLTFGYQQERDKVTDDRWEREFGANRSDAEQALAWQFVQTALSNGNIPSDELLAKAGLTRADAEMMAKKAGGGGGGRGGNPGKNETGNPNVEKYTNNINKEKPVSDESLFAGLENYNNTDPRAGRDPLKVQNGKKTKQGG